MGVPSLVLKEIREATNKAWVLGEGRFIKQIEKQTARRGAPKPRGGDRKSKNFSKKWESIYSDSFGSQFIEPAPGITWIIRSSGFLISIFNRGSDQQCRQKNKHMGAVIAKTGKLLFDIERHGSATATITITVWADNTFTDFLGYVRRTLFVNKTMRLELANF